MFLSNRLTLSVHTGTCFRPVRFDFYHINGR